MNLFKVNGKQGRPESHIRKDGWKSHPQKIRLARGKNGLRVEQMAHVWKILGLQ